MRGEPFSGQGAAAAASNGHLIHLRQARPRLYSGCCALVVLLSLSIGCEPSHNTAPKTLTTLATRPEGAQLSAETRGQIEHFCGDCHALPSPSSFDRDRWHFEVKRGYEFYAKSGRNDLTPPPLQATLEYFRSRAPAELEYPQPGEAEGSPPVKFVEERFSLNTGLGILPEIAALRWATLSPDGPPLLLATDIRHGHLVAVDVQPEKRAPPQLVAQLRNPGRIEICHLDSDGYPELLVADLAGYLPADHLRSELIMLRRSPESGLYEQSALLTDMGRISDVRAGDLDGDQQLDLVIAEFGWRDTGRLLVARNVSQPGGKRIEFDAPQVIDDRPGALNVRLHDFSGNGRLDIAAIFSQEYESIELYRNGPGPTNAGLLPRLPIVRRTLWSGLDLTFGCSGLELVDLNQDGQVDLLFTNGDALDNSYVSPWHGVQWLENKGGGEFEYHRLADLLGAYSAQAADFDGDGLLDIMVVARLPSTRYPVNLPRAASIVFLHQVEPGEFARYTLEWDSPFYPSLAVEDFNGDGHIDFAVAPGPYVSDVRQARNEEHYLSVWWNSGP